MCDLSPQDCKGRGRRARSIWGITTPSSDTQWICNISVNNSVGKGTVNLRLVYIVILRARSNLKPCNGKTWWYWLWSPLGLLESDQTWNWFTARRVETYIVRHSMSVNKREWSQAWLWHNTTVDIDLIDFGITSPLTLTYNVLGNDSTTRSQGVISETLLWSTAISPMSAILGFSQNEV